MNSKKPGVIPASWRACSVLLSDAFRMCSLGLLTRSLGLMQGLHRTFLALRMVILAILFGSSPMRLRCGLVILCRFDVCLLHSVLLSPWPVNTGGKSSASIMFTPRDISVLKKKRRGWNQHASRLKERQRQARRDCACLLYTSPSPRDRQK